MSKPKGEKCKTCFVVNNRLRCSLCKWKTEEWLWSQPPAPITISGDEDLYKERGEQRRMREYIPKDEVLDIIKSMPMDLVEEYIYMTKGIWLDDDEEKLQLSPETSTNDKDICEQIKKHAERIKAETDKNPDSLWANGMRSFDVLDDSTTSKTETVDTPTNTPTEDCISRQAAIDAVERALFKRVAKAFIESLPPVEPKRPRGKWVELVQPHQVDCTGCKFVGTYDTDFPCANCVRKTKDYYCGAEMGGDKE